MDVTSVPNLVKNLINLQGKAKETAYAWLAKKFLQSELSLDELNFGKRDDNPNLIWADVNDFVSKVILSASEPYDDEAVDKVIALIKDVKLPLEGQVRYDLLLAYCTMADLSSDKRMVNEIESVPLGDLAFEISFCQSLCSSSLVGEAFQRVKRVDKNFDLSSLLDELNPNLEYHREFAGYILENMNCPSALPRVILFYFLEWGDQDPLRFSALSKYIDRMVANDWKIQNCEDYAALFYEELPNAEIKRLLMKIFDNNLIDFEVGDNEVKQTVDVLINFEENESFDSDKFISCLEKLCNDGTVSFIEHVVIGLLFSSINEEDAKRLYLDKKMQVKFLRFLDRLVVLYGLTSLIIPIDALITLLVHFATKGERDVKKSANWLAHHIFVKIQVTPLVLVTILRYFPKEVKYINLMEDNLGNTLEILARVSREMADDKEQKAFVKLVEKNLIAELPSDLLSEMENELALCLVAMKFDFEDVPSSLLAKIKTVREERVREQIEVAKLEDEINL